MLEYKHYVRMQTLCSNANIMFECKHYVRMQTLCQACYEMSVSHKGTCATTKSLDCGKEQLCITEKVKTLIPM